MKRFSLLFILIAAAFFATACGSPTQPSEQPAAPEAPTQANATEAPAVSGNQVDITLADNTIDASMTTFQVGVPYTFVVTNAGHHAHNFNINPPVSLTGSLEGALDSALLVVPQEQLGVGDSVTVEYTFPASAAGQLLEFSCLIKRHYDDGMRLDITVTE